MFRIRTALHAYRHDESGAGTVWSIFWTVIFLICAGFVIDTSHAYRTKIVLQATADSSALAGIMTYSEKQRYVTLTADASDVGAEDRAIKSAVILGDSIMAFRDANGKDINGEVVPEANVIVGTWSGGSFSPLQTGEEANAVKVTALRTKSNGNSLGALLLDAFTPFDHWDLGATAVAAIDFNDCYSKATIYAGHTLNLASNNTFSGSLCLHGDTAVDMQANNLFNDDEVQVSSAAIDNFQGAGEGGIDGLVDINPSLEGNYGTNDFGNKISLDVYNKVANSVNEILAAPTTSFDSSLESWGTYEMSFVPSQLTTQADGTVTYGGNANVESMSAAEFQMKLDGKTSKNDKDAEVPMELSFDPKTIYLVEPLTVGPGKNGQAGDCKDTLAINAGQLISGLVLKTSCKIQINTGAMIQDSFIWTQDGTPATQKQNTDCGFVLDGACVPLDGDNDFKGSAAITAGADVHIGYDGNDTTCGGGSKIMAMGDINLASGAYFEQSQVISAGDIHMAAKSGGLNGTQVFTRGDVFMAALAEWSAGDCSVPDDAWELADYKLVL